MPRASYCIDTISDADCAYLLSLLIPPATRRATISSVVLSSCTIDAALLLLAAYHRSSKSCMQRYHPRVTRRQSLTSRDPDGCHGRGALHVPLHSSANRLRLIGFFFAAIAQRLQRMLLPPLLASCRAGPGLLQDAYNDLLSPVVATTRSVPARNGDHERLTERGGELATWKVLRSKPGQLEQ